MIDTRITETAGAKPVIRAVKHTLLVKFGDDKLREFPVSAEHTLGSQWDSWAGTALSKHQSFLPAWCLGEVYGYIINRREEFKHPYYGWALPR